MFKLGSLKLLFFIYFTLCEGQVVEHGSSLLANRAEDNDSGCGGVLQATSSPTTLQYKYKKPVNRYESCVWTVQGITSVIKLNILETFFRDAGNIYAYIAVGYFNESNYDQLESLVWKRINRLNPQLVEVPGPVAFIHYVTTDYPGLGFRLTYEAVGEEQSSIYNFDNYFVGGEYGAFKYPPGPSDLPYQNNQRTTIVIKAESGLRVTNPIPSTLLIQKISLQNSVNCTLDSLTMYSFGEEGNRWYQNRTLCGTDTNLRQYYIYHPRNDPIILTFKSDSTEEGYGFDFFWMTYPFE